jgi:hypothetical protein
VDGVDETICRSGPLTGRIFRHALKIRRGRTKARPYEFGHFKRVDLGAAMNLVEGRAVCPGDSDALITRFAVGSIGWCW